MKMKNYSLTSDFIRTKDGQTCNNCGQILNKKRLVNLSCCSYDVSSVEARKRIACQKEGLNDVK